MANIQVTLIKLITVTVIIISKTYIILKIVIDLTGIFYSFKSVI